MRLPHTALRQLACALALTTLSAVSYAAPYAVRYNGIIAGSTFSEILDGESYEVTLVVDNGNATAENQTWNLSHLVCALWAINDARDVRFTHALSGNDDGSAIDSITTDGAGALSSMFSLVFSNGATPGNYSYSGFTPTPVVRWYLNDIPAIFMDDNFEFQDAQGSGGVPMDTTSWSAPVPYDGDCPTFPAQSPAAEPIPTLSEWGALALAGLLALAAAAGIRRRPPKLGA